MTRLLVACEESGVVTEAFRNVGIEAFSCDVKPTSGNLPQFHIQADVLSVLNEGWDAMIAFPPCTHLAASGARYFAAKRADGRQQRAIDFFLSLANADIPRIAVENPVGIMSSVWRPPDQCFQPWMFGHDASKKTCLWLKNLPPLEHDHVVAPHGWRLLTDDDLLMIPNAAVRIAGYLFLPTIPDAGTRPRWRNQTPSGQNKLPPSQDRAAIRSKTYLGVAKAMAVQWRRFLVSRCT